MKTSKLFTLDVEIAEKLKQNPNSSKLVNGLLKEYFSIRAGNENVFEEKKAIITDLKKKLDSSTKNSRLLRSLKHWVSTISVWLGLKGLFQTRSPQPIKSGSMQRPD